MKKLFCMLLALAMSAAMVCGALAVTLYEPDEEDKDYTTAGWYKVYCIEPAGHDYVYIYDKPSSSKGDSQCRADDGEIVYIYYTTSGIGKKGSIWGYCTYESPKKGTVVGFIRYSNVVPEEDYDSVPPKPTPTPTPTPKPTARPTQATPRLETMRVVNCNSWVSLREYPDTDSNRLRKVYKGEEVIGYSYNAYWVACYYDGEFGYILAEYLE